jgi:uncharacterized protein
MPWLRSDGDDVVLTLHVQPGAKTTSVAGLHGDALKIRLAAPPVDGKANAALLSFLREQILNSLQVSAGKTAIKKGDITCTLIAGDQSRQKRVRISGVSSDDARAALFSNANSTL